MSLRFGSGWLVIYFLICSCTFKCSAPQLRARDYTTFNPFEPLPFSLSPRILGFGSPSPPLQGRAALTVEVTRPRGRPASRCCVGAFQNSQRLEMCGAPRSGQRGWSTCTPSRVHIPDVLSGSRTSSSQYRLVRFGVYQTYRGESWCSTSLAILSVRASEHRPNVRLAR